MSEKSAIEKVIENYNDETSKLKATISKLNDELNTISTASYNSGIPDTKFNRGDEGSDFSFPIKWGQTCKRMEKSIYLEPVLSFFRTVFNTFDYYIEKPENYDSDIKVKLAYDFFVKQFKRAGGLQNLIVDIAYNTLVYGFNFFTPKLEVMNGSLYGLKGNYECLKGFKFYDPTLLYSFTFNEKEADELQAVKIFTSPKQLGCSEELLYNDYLDSILLNGSKTKEKNQQLITIDFDTAIAGYCSYGSYQGDPLGKPFLYSVYPIWKILENMDNSFNRNLSNIGEHSFNFVLYNPQEAFTAEHRNTTLKEIREFINKKGGVFIGTYGRLEKIESIDANEWYNFRDGMLSTIFKNKGIDIKSLGLNRGATRDLASLAQSDSILTAFDIVNKFINQINQTFMKRYFDLNFKALRLKGICDYFVLKCEVPAGNVEAVGKNENNNSINDDVYLSGTDFSSSKKPIVNKSAIPLSNFIKQMPNDGTEFIINATDLENILVRSREELRQYLISFIKNAMNDDALIEKALKNPTKFIRGSLFNKTQRQELYDKIYNLLKSDAYSFFQYKASEILNGVGGLSFVDVFGKSLDDWIDTQLNLFLKNKIKVITDDLAAKVEQVAINNLFNMSRGYSNDIDINIAKDFVKEKILQFKGKQLDSIVDNEVITTFQHTSDIANKSAAQEIDDLVVLRCGVLEKMCSHCQKYFGVLYKKDSQGNFYNIDHKYIELPDKDCLGGANNCKCYYVPVSMRTLDIINNLLKKEA